MSRASDELSDEDAELVLASAHERDPDGSETQPLRTLSNDASSEDVEDFVITQGLADQQALFQKAARTLCRNVDDQHLDGLTPQEADALRRESTHKWQQPWTLYLTIFVCSLGAIEQGWAQTGMNGANLYLPAAFGLDSNSTHDSFVLGLINCGLYLAQGLLGCWLSEPLNKRMGRRGTIFVGASLCLIGNLGASISWSWPILVLFRLILGTGLGVNSSIVSVFAAESAPAYIRGGLGVSWQMFTAFGVFLGFLANAAVAIHFEGRDNLIWRVLLGAPLVPTVPLLLTVYSCAESPAWHISRGHYDKALESLDKLRNTKLQAACELYSNYLSRRRHKSPKDHLSYFAKYRSLFTIPRNRHALMASYTVMYVY